MRSILDIEQELSGRLDSELSSLFHFSKAFASLFTDEVALTLGSSMRVATARVAFLIERRSPARRRLGAWT